MRYPFNGNFNLSQTFGGNPEDYKRFNLQGHNGLDFATPTGTPLLAPHTGMVLEVADEGKDGYGKYVKVENDNEGSVFAHLKEIVVKIGDVVREGQLLGYTNNTGNSTGPHVHWGYYKKPRDRSNGYLGYIDQLSLLDDTVTVTIEGGLRVRTTPQTNEKNIISGRSFATGDIVSVEKAVEGSSPTEGDTNLWWKLKGEEAYIWAGGTDPKPEEPLKVTISSFSDADLELITSLRFSHPGYAGWKDSEMLANFKAGDGDDKLPKEPVQETPKVADQPPTTPPVVDLPETESPGVSPSISEDLPSSDVTSSPQGTPGYALYTQEQYDTVCKERDVAVKRYNDMAAFFLELHTLTGDAIEFKNNIEEKVLKASSKLSLSVNWFLTKIKLR